MSFQACTNPAVSSKLCGLRVKIPDALRVAEKPDRIWQKECEMPRRRREARGTDYMPRNHLRKESSISAQANTAGRYRSEKSRATEGQWEYRKRQLKKGLYRNEKEMERGLEQAPGKR